MTPLLQPNRHALARVFSLAMICLSPPSYADKTAPWLDAVTVSGYAKLATSSPNRAPTAVELDDLSLFVSGKFNRWLNPFMEAEAYKIPLWEEGKGAQFNMRNWLSNGCITIFTSQKTIYYVPVNS
jgi:hypothetical protein